ncbi:ATP-binding cassette domain-containing protein [uncultured Clostridium sp.]|uniref:ABC transporter ATP-binding protein n=1 Tax=uncultured Clostridium sp. TaxID=59620 RepID=UPI002639DD4F|nr:ATP-binding cassette domain-containing protein [uncultured Clostridium sp.]
MRDYVIRTKNISKKYGKQYALKDVNINIKKGDIYGLIGKNGAGKTTLMRVITGLSNQIDGKLELFSTTDKIIKMRKRIGVLIESPAFFEDLDAYKNLEFIRRVRGIPGKNCIKEKLELVGLKDIKGKAVKDFSLGMKQKLGLAIALLADPEVLILDEPTNGLDPMGIVNMRELLKKLNREMGITILISSHILNELSQMATVYGIMKDGELVEEITMEELEEKSKQALELQVDDAEKATWVLENILNIEDYKVLNNGILKIYERINDGKFINKEFTKEDILVEKMIVNGESLEDYVLNVMEGNDD